MKTRFVKFSNGVVRDASLEIPAEAFSPMDAAQLVISSYVAWCFRRDGHNVLFSDEVAVSSIGKSHFFEGALGGYKDRVEPKFFELLKSVAEDEVTIALAVVRHRQPGISDRDAWEAISHNKALKGWQREAALGIAKAHDAGLYPAAK